MGSTIWSGHDFIHPSKSCPGYFCATDEEKKTKFGLYPAYSAFSGEFGGLWTFNF